MFSLFLEGRSYFNIAKHDISILDKSNRVVAIPPCGWICKSSEISKTIETDLPFNVVTKTFGDAVLETKDKKIVTKEEFDEMIPIGACFIASSFTSFPLISLIKEFKREDVVIFVPDAGQTAVRDEKGQVSHVVSIVCKWGYGVKPIV